MPAFTIAQRLAGRTGDQLLAGALGKAWANPSGFPLYRSADVDGRRTVYPHWEFYTKEDVLYFFLYYGGYECAKTGRAAPFAPQDETERWMPDFVRAIPDRSANRR